MIDVCYLVLLERVDTTNIITDKAKQINRIKIISSLSYSYDVNIYLPDVDTPRTTA